MQEDPREYIPDQTMPPSGPPILAGRLRAEIPNALRERLGHEALQGVRTFTQLQLVPASLWREPIREIWHVPDWRESQGQCHSSSFRRRYVVLRASSKPILT